MRFFSEIGYILHRGNLRSCSEETSAIAVFSFMLKRTFSCEAKCRYRKFVYNAKEEIPKKNRFY